LIVIAGVLLVPPPPSQAGSTGARCRFTTNDLPRFVLRKRDMPKGTSVYDSGYGTYISLPKGTVTDYGFEFDMGRDRAATSHAFLFRSPAAAHRGLAALKRAWAGGLNPKPISADHLGQERWGLRSQVGLVGSHFGWRVDNVDLLFSYRGGSQSVFTSLAALTLAKRMARRVHC